jgi:DNA-binding response OmpR family regulator
VEPVAAYEDLASFHDHVSDADGRDHVSSRRGSAFAHRRPEATTIQAVSLALSFGPFELDGRSHVLRRDGQRVSLSDRHALLLLLLATNAGEVVSKDGR